uniref:SH2 domain-containing protein n=1 Tax=Heterorhabditis bacteriophora TaxID=37862 RepID=A0A1I7WYZ2_HETBA
MSLPHRRLPSDVAHDLFKTLIGRFRRDDTKRSLSTGDLADRESDYMIIDYSQAPTTSSLTPHFDDCDRVPMRFGKGSPCLMKQYLSSARQLMLTGSQEKVDDVPLADLHRSQLWFYQDLNTTKAERLLLRTGCEEGSFVIHNFATQYVLSYVHSATIHHIRIGYSVKENGEAKFRLDIDKSFKNLCDLVSYYRKHKGFILPMRLKNGVSRPIRLNHAPLRTRA